MTRVSSQSLVLSSRPTSLRDCSNRIQVGVGEHIGKHIDPSFPVDQPNKDLARRQQTPVFVAPKSTVFHSLSQTPTIRFPFSTSTVTQTAPVSSATGHMSFSVVEKTLIPLDDSLAHVLPDQLEPP